MGRNMVFPRSRAFDFNDGNEMRLRHPLSILSITASASPACFLRGLVVRPDRSFRPFERFCMMSLLPPIPSPLLSSRATSR